VISGGFPVLRLEEAFMSIRYGFALSLLPLLAACASGGGTGTRGRTDSGVFSRDGATVITGVALSDGRGSILSAIRGKVPSFRVTHPAGGCPRISLRNFVTFATVVNPHVYVDGTRTIDTCVLESLRTQDVDTVEVYAMGFTRRPGYAPHPHGLILVFLRGAQ
jgi:hypothetical protein